MSKIRKSIEKNLAKIAKKKRKKRKRGELENMLRGSALKNDFQWDFSFGKGKF